MIGEGKLSLTLPRTSEAPYGKPPDGIWECLYVCENETHRDIVARAIPHVNARYISRYAGLAGSRVKRVVFFNIPEDSYNPRVREYIDYLLRTKIIHGEEQVIHFI